MIWNNHQFVITDRRLSPLFYFFIIVCQYLKNETAVAKSRMFPFRFYTAFDVLSDLEDFSKKSYEKPKNKNLDQKMIDRIMKTNQEKMKTMNKNAIKKFEQALNDAIAVATKKNIPPLSGNWCIVFY